MQAFRTRLLSGLCLFLLSILDCANAIAGDFYCTSVVDDPDAAYAAGTSPTYNVTEDIFTPMDSKGDLTQRWCSSGPLGTIEFNVTKTPIPLRYFNATINTLLADLEPRLEENANFEYESAIEPGGKRSFCTNPTRQTRTRPIVDEECLYLHIASHNITYSVSVLESIQESERSPPVSTYPLQVYWSNVVTIAIILKYAVGTPLEMSFNLTSPILRTDIAFASGCLNFSPDGCPQLPEIWNSSTIR